MVTVVLDTNVLISALLGHGKPRSLVTKLFAGQVIVTSKQMLAELGDVLSREKFLEVRNAYAHEFLLLIVSRSLLVSIRQTPKIVAEDPDDDIVLATAYDGQAEYIVTGDKHLLKLGEFKRVKIVTVNEMLEILQHEART